MLESQVAIFLVDGNPEPPVAAGRRGCEQGSQDMISWQHTSSWMWRSSLQKDSV
jgi:hypothetical protein